MDCVKTEKIPKDEMSNYDPLCVCFVEGATDSTGRLTKTVEKLSDTEWKVTGIITNVGRPIAFSTTFILGESFSFPQLYESGTDQLAKPIVTQFIGDIDEMLTYATGLQQEYDKELKVAEQYEAEEYGAYLTESGKMFGSESIPEWVANWNCDTVIPKKTLWKAEYFKQSEFERKYWNDLKKAIHP